MVFDNFWTWDDFTREKLIETANEWAKSQARKIKKDRMKKQMMLNMRIIKRGFVFKFSKSLEFDSLINGKP